MSADLKNYILSVELQGHEKECAALLRRKDGNVQQLLMTTCLPDRESESTPAELRAYRNIPKGRALVAVAKTKNGMEIPYFLYSAQYFNLFFNMAWQADFLREYAVASFVWLLVDREFAERLSYLPEHLCVQSMRMSITQQQPVGG